MPFLGRVSDSIYLVVSVYMKRFFDSAYDGRSFWNKFYSLGPKDEPCGDPLICSFHASAG